MSGTVDVASQTPNARPGMGHIIGLAVRVVAIAAFLLLTNAGFMQRVILLIGQERWGTLVGFLGLWGLCFVALLIAAFQRNVWIRLFWASVIAVTAAIGFSFREASGTELGIFDVMSLWNARHEASRALDFYGSSLPMLLLVLAAGFIVMMTPPVLDGAVLRRWMTRLAWVPVVPVVAIAGIIYAKDGGGGQVLPVQFAPLSVGLVAGSALATETIPARSAVAWTPGPAKVRHIVMLVDESVRADYIDWTPGNPYTPALASLKSRIADFGPSASGGNCSHYSNALLRFMAAPNQVGRQLLSNPTIWQYAKKAGFRTVFVDSQAAFNRNPGKLQNFMTQDEAKDIDVFIAMPEDTPTPELDERLLDKVLAELRSEQPLFIYATKNGAHFPYDRTYPESERPFRPTMSEALQTQATGNDVSQRTMANYAAAGTMDTRMNSYRNSLGWSVDRFFKRLLNDADLKDTAIIYTSDHGQVFNPNRLSHCSVDDPDPREALVPLFVLTGDPALRERFAAGAAMNRNHGSHFAIAPTVLELLGYSKKDIAGAYGASLFERNTARPRFTTGDIFGLFSDRVRWHDIDLSKTYLEKAGSAPEQNVSKSTTGTR